MSARCCAVCREPFTPSPTGRRRRYCSDACRKKAYRRRAKRKGDRLAAMLSSKTDDWATPQDVFDELHAEFAFDLDVCASAENAKCARYFTRADDGLAQEWTGRVWMNPPYGRTIEQWVAKAAWSSRTTAELVVCLLPARTDTRWWHEYVVHGEIRLVRGRLQFGGADASAPFPSAVVVFRPAFRPRPARDETRDETGRGA